MHADVLGKSDFARRARQLCQMWPVRLQDPQVERHDNSHLSPFEVSKSFGLARSVGLPAFVILAAMAV
jgi:hypothetical protein